MWFSALRRASSRAASRSHGSWWTPSRSTSPAWAGRVRLPRSGRGVLRLTKLAPARLRQGGGGGRPRGPHPHELRHPAASLAISSGANVKDVQRLLGHLSGAMTLDVYAGLFEDPPQRPIHPRLAEHQPLPAQLEHEPPRTPPRMPPACLQHGHLRGRLHLVRARDRPVRDRSASPPNRPPRTAPATRAASAGTPPTTPRPPTPSGHHR